MVQIAERRGGRVCPLDGRRPDLPDRDVEGRAEHDQRAHRRPAERLPHQLHHADRESWSYETDAQGQFFLQYRQGDEWKEDRVELFCNRTAAPRALSLAGARHAPLAPAARTHRRIVDLANRGLSVFWQLDAPRQDGFADMRNVHAAALRDHRTAEGQRARQRHADHRCLAALPRCPEPARTRFQIVTTEPDAERRRRLQPDFAQPRPRQDGRYRAILPLEQARDRDMTEEHDLARRRLPLRRRALRGRDPRCDRGRGLQLQHVLAHGLSAPHRAGARVSACSRAWTTSRPTPSTPAWRSTCSAPSAGSSRSTCRAPTRTGSA